MEVLDMVTIALATAKQQKAELKYLYSLLNPRSLFNLSFKFLVVFEVLLLVVKVVKVLRMAQTEEPLARD